MKVREGERWNGDEEEQGIDEKGKNIGRSRKEGE